MHRLEREYEMTQAVFDAALSLRDIADGASVAAASGAPLAIAVDQLLPCSWVVHTTTVASGGGDEGYVFTLGAATTSGGAYTTIATLSWPSGHAPGKLLVPISGDLSKFLNPKSTYLQVTMTPSGASPSTIWGSYLAKSASGLGVAARPGDTLLYAT
jgi:hypothetical protein